MTRASLVALVGALAIAGAPSAVAQLAVPSGAEGTLSILETGTSVYLDASKSKLGLYLSGDPMRAIDPTECSPLEGDARDACVAQQQLDRLESMGRWFYDVSLAVSAKDGERSLFSGGEVVPGFEVAASVNRTQELRRGYVHGFAAARGSWASVKTATESNGVYTLDTEDSGAVGYTLGVNWFINESERLGIGLAHSGDQLWASTRSLRTVEVCVRQAAGTDVDGIAVDVSRCSDRYLAPLDDPFVTRTGLSFVAPLPTIGQAPVSLAGGATVQTGIGDDPTLDLSIGPVLHPVGRPRHTLVALVFGFEDVTDANDLDRSFEDVFSVELFVGIRLPD